MSKPFSFKSNIKAFSISVNLSMKAILLLLVVATIACKKEANIPIVDEPFPANPGAFYVPLDDTFSNNTRGLIEAAFLDVDGDRVADFDVILSNTDERSTFSILIIGAGENQIADTTSTVVKVLEPLRKINSTLTKWSKSGYVVNNENGDIHAIGTNQTILTGIKVVKSGKIYFGWMKIEIPRQTGTIHSVILKSYALEQQESVAVKAGVEYL